MTSDLAFFVCRNDLDRFRHHAQGLQTSRNCGPNLQTVLTDATCENQHVDATQQGDVSADRLADRNYEDIQS